MRTLTIAGNERTARTISNYFMHLEVMPWSTRVGSAEQYEWCSAWRASRKIIGQRWDRIVIGTDYLRWDAGPPGELTALWQSVQLASRFGAEVVFR